VTAGKGREALRIIALCVGAAVVHGIAHDLVTAHVCVEYFTLGHPPVFATGSPVLLALGWGVLATWWVGLLLGGLLAFAALRGPQPRRTARSLVRPVGVLLAAMAAVAAMAGVLGFLLASKGLVVLVEPLASRVPPPRHAAFLADLWAHSASYLAGCIGGLVLTARVWRARQRLPAPEAADAMAAAAAAPRTKAGIFTMLGLVGSFFVMLFAALTCVATFPTEDYRPMMLQAILAAAVSTALAASCWRRVPVLVRVLLGLVVLADASICLHAASRLG
jgi:hypothetical protein